MPSRTARTSPTAPGHSRADLLADGEGTQLHPELVITKHCAAGQVDEQQRLTLLVPVRRLADVGMEVGKYLDTHTRRTGHVPSLFGVGSPKAEIEFPCPRKRLLSAVTVGRLRYFPTA